MKKPSKGQRGFVMLYVLILMTALLMMIGSAYALICSVHKQTAQDKQELAARAALIGKN